MQRKDVEASVDATAAALSLPLDPAHRPGVLLYFELAAGLADLVMRDPLGLDDDPAGVFTPIATEDLPTRDPRRLR